MRIIGARRRYQARAKFTTWMYRIAHNRVIDGYRADNSRRIESLDDDSTATQPAAGAADEPERRAASDQQAARLQSLVAELPAEQRDVFLLHEEGGLALEAIAQVSGVGRETVKSRLRYALSKLRRALKDES
jgi:RNA polymerase sigma-70 factor (ECF subfamily)